MRDCFARGTKKETEEREKLRSEKERKAEGERRTEERVHGRDV
jgi:hypothetical protein